jgi:hypothetical protein
MNKMKTSQTLTTIMAATAALLLTPNLYALTDIGWNPAGNPNQPSDNKYSTAANWNLGVVPTDGYKAKFYNSPAVSCIVDFTTGNAQVVLGDGGPGSMTIVNGGVLNAGALVNPDGDGWTAISYSAPAELTIENGGTVHFNYHLWVGLTSTSHGTLTMNGGTATVGGMFGLGSDDNAGLGFANINGGTLTLNQWSSSRSIKDGSRLNIAGGTVIINGDQTGSVNAYIAAGKITAYGGAGTVNVDYNNINPGKTTLTASGGATPPQQGITSISVSGSDATITYNTTPGFTYHLESTADLAAPAWSLVSGSGTNATGTSATFTDASGGSDMRFYRSVSP